MHALQLPLTRESIRSLRAFDRVTLHGSILVGRDQVHRKLCDLLEQGKPLPISLTGETIYYMGPSATPEQRVIGSCGPTTSARMDPFTPTLMDAGLLAHIGKGPRNDDVVEAIKRNRGIYFVAFGGCGALYATKVVSMETIAFEELGPEALMRLEIADFPAIVGIDCIGNSVFV